MRTSEVFVPYVEPLDGLPADVLVLRERLVALVRGVLDDAVAHGRVELGRLLHLLASPAAAAELFEGDLKLLGHEVVDDGVDGTVGVDAHTTEEQEPGAVVGRVDEGVDHHQGSVRHPEQGKEGDHHRQHLCDLRTRELPFI